MTMEVWIPVVEASGKLVARLRLVCLHKQDRWRDLETLVDRRTEGVLPSAAAPVQLLEEISYAYEVRPTVPLTVDHLEPENHFSYSDRPAVGRLDAKRSTGTLAIDVVFTDSSRGRCEVEVRSRKLDYETEYRNMLLRIAREAAELVQSAFAPSSLPAFRPETIRDPETIYQRFAFIQALLSSESVRTALHTIARRPHMQHVGRDRVVNPARSARAGPKLARQLVAHGPRQPVACPVAGLTSVPHLVTETTYEATYDTVPNRFVKYVLTRWSNIALDVQQSLSGAAPSQVRGRREARDVLDELEEALSSAPIKEAGPLEHFPHSNQVLQGRSGYREILEAFLLAEAAATIDWDASERLFKAGQRNVAELYEYWVFLELVRIVESLKGFTLDKRNLVKRTANGLALELRRTGSAVVTGIGTRRGTPVEVRIWFNKSFPRTGSTAGSSWTIGMRPDCSIEIAPRDRTLEADTWIHFDAKYRIQDVSDTLDELASADAELQIAASEHAVPTDLAKMHAYRDAIRRTAGAYVLYPGGDYAQSMQRRQYHEILPGLGAFALRPVEDGNASTESTQLLANFIDDVVDHVAAQGTAAERARYWTSRSYAAPSRQRIDFSSLLRKPPDDTAVLLGYVRSCAHLTWILDSGLYNLRADAGRPGAVGLDAPELSPDFVLTYSAEGSSSALLQPNGLVIVRTASELSELGYPNPRGSRYLCLEVACICELDDRAEAAIHDIVEEMPPSQPWGAPKLVSWTTIASAILHMAGAMGE